HGDVMASFSSRGPNAAPDLLKPDVTAPGVDILAAFHTPDPANPGPDEYGIISGTSMSSPHVAGSGALLRALHPDWTPDQVKSALMTTAFNAPAGGKEVHPILKEDSATPADPFDVGAGRVDLSQAGRAGFVLDESLVNYQNASPDLGGDPAALNLPSLADGDCDGACSWTRILEGSAAGAVSWTVAVEATGDMGLTVTPAAFTLSQGETVTVRFAADVTAVEPKGTWVFARVVFLPDDPSIPAAHFPVAVFAAGEAIERTTFHFQGNLDEGCTGDGATDITACDGPFLSENPVLDAGPAASWGPVQTVLNGGNDRTIYDPNWIWHLDEPVTLGGPMTVEWWYGCPGCNLVFSDDFTIRLWADGALVLEQRLTFNVALPGVPRLLKTTVSVPNVTASESLVLHVDPVYLNQDGGLIYYDSVEACPGGSAAPCASVVKIPVTGSGTSAPVTGPPFLHPVSDDADPDWEDGVDRDGSYRLTWDAPAEPATAVCTYLVEEGTFMGTVFSDDAEEPLLLGSNSNWTGAPEWNSAPHPDTGTQGYSVLYVDNLDASLAMANPVGIPAGMNAVLSFASFENSEPGFDYAHVEASGDGGPFVTLATYNGLFSGVRTVDLSGFAGQSVVVRFRFDTDDLVSFAVGWIIDDIRIDVDDFSQIANVDGGTLAYDVIGRTDGAYFYRVAGLFGDCAGEPVSGPYSNVQSIVVEIPEQTGGFFSAAGGGWLSNGNGPKLNFGFSATGSEEGMPGHLHLNDRAADIKINISTLTFVGPVTGACGSIQGGDNSVEFHGEGTINGAAAGFRTCVQDNGEPGTADLFYLECTAGCSYTTRDLMSSDVLGGGNINVVTEPAGETGGDATGESDPEATTLILYPILQTEGIIGQVQTFTVVVYDQYNQPMSDVAVSLSQILPDGGNSTLTAVTGLDGVAVFTALNLSVSAEYIASVGAVQSNAVLLDPVLK
ncbi:MAG TPA: S8 family serine peptidase, partial [Anaerolineales bacterium]|nr:S8 family serine peptidase [Anaerolineales bacterium]